MEIKIMKNIMHANQKLADENREFFKDRRITAVNVMASPGAGKTSIISRVIEELNGSVNVSVIEGDIASSIDAEKIDSMGIPVVQINTGGGCHLDANMIKAASTDLNLRENTILFIENVGNLVCPSSFDLGESIRMVIASVPEGHDKPYKYTSMFESADVVILNKTDLMPYIDFDSEFFYKGIKALNEKVPVFEISCKSGQGMKEFIEWLKDKAEG
jgi:hydrogenase nickel incorporation protein HypB